MFRGGKAAAALALWMLLGPSGCATLRTRALASPRGSRVVLVAHRGASAYAPENTIAAYREAFERGAEIAECDVHLSRDGELIVMHDPTVDRTTDGSGEVSELTLAEISRLDAGAHFDKRFRGEPVPTLAQLLDFVRGRLALFIEVKSGPETIEPLAALLRARRRQRKQVAIISFDEEVVAESEARMPDIPTMLLVWTGPGQAKPGAEAVDRVVALGAEMIGVSTHGASPELVALAHEARIGVFVYTVNDAANTVRLVEYGVDGIHTDAPDFVREVLDAAPI